MKPDYISLYYSGELQRRAKELEARLASCDVCPRLCKVNRLKNEWGVCASGYLPVVSNVCDHHGEEPAISGTKGTGAIFWGNCNMKCLYCQNYKISQGPGHQKGKEMSIHALAERMIYLQDGLGCHNISFISPSPFVPQILMALIEAIPLGLRVPLVYNTNAYDSLDMVKALDGIIDIYLPDLKYSDDILAMKYSQARDYVATARAAINEMYRQVGNLVVGDDGLARSGLIVRHLILPNDIAGSRDSLTWLAREVSPDVTVSIMSQYYPIHLAPHVPLLSRTISASEYAIVVELVDELGLENGWVQELDSAENYLPDFEKEGHPFAPTYGK